MSERNLRGHESKRVRAAMSGGAALGGLAAIALGQWVTPVVDAPGVEHRVFHSAAADRPVSYHVYAPAAYHENPDRCFPVLYWLHGSNAMLMHISPLSAWFDNAIAAELIPPMLVVFPNGLAYSMWCNSKDGSVPMESVVIDDLIPEVDASFRTIAAREGRIIEGFSMGGYGAARLGLRHHQLFAGASILGAGPLQLDFLDEPKGTQIPWALRLQIYETVWGSDPEYYLEQSPWMIAGENAQAVIENGLVIRQAIGALDFTLPANIDFHQRMTDLGMPHTFDAPEGVGHSTPALLSALGAENWAFYREIFGRTCSGDLNGDGVVDGVDLAIVLNNWGECAPRSIPRGAPRLAPAEGDPGCPGDVNADGMVNGVDLATVLASWGACGSRGRVSGGEDCLHGKERTGS